MKSSVLLSKSIEILPNITFNMHVSMLNLLSANDIYYIW